MHGLSLYARASESLGRELPKERKFVKRSCRNWMVDVESFKRKQNLSKWREMMHYFLNLAFFAVKLDKERERSRIELWRLTFWLRRACE